MLYWGEVLVVHIGRKNEHAVVGLLTVSMRSTLADPRKATLSMTFYRPSKANRLFLR